MTITKLTNKNVITDEDLNHNQKIGLPIEVFCTNNNETVAFGIIQSYDANCVYINGNKYCREKYVFFGLPCL